MGGKKNLKDELLDMLICPITQEVVFSQSTVRDCLSVMSTCGMYDYSGEFAFTVGLPAKSGV